MLQFYDTAKKAVTPFSLPNTETVNLYSCGPTVYDYAHIGNLRSFIAADSLYRALRANDYRVDWVMNITDIDDKTIKGTLSEYGPSAGVTELMSYTKKFREAFLSDLHAVNVGVENIRLINVTEVIPEIQAFIIRLLEQGLAYTADDGSTYFSIEKYQAQFSDYGSLVGQKFLEGKQIGARVRMDEYDKDNLSDFALWKAWSKDDGQIYWDHPQLGKGRPGWHIECSAINRLAFAGEPTHIHTGGVDLIFPHHTNEIAQSQPLGPFVQHWFHIEHLMVENQKMAKSAKNFYTLRDIESRGFTGEDLRLTFLQSNFHTQQNFTWDAIQASANIRKKLSPAENGQPVVNGFLEALNDNLNTAEALATALQHRDNFGPYARILGLNLMSEQIEIPAEVKKLVDNRAEARSQNDYALADELRDRIGALGYTVTDTASGQKISKI